MTGSGGRGTRRWGVSHTLMVPPVEESLVHSPTWVRGRAPEFEDGDPVTLVMALEAEPEEGHASMIGAHVEVLTAWVGVGEKVLSTTPLEAPERRAVGFALLMFAAELASVLGSPEFSPGLAVEVRHVAAEAIAAATLRAGGCLAGVVSEFLMSVA